VLKDLQARLARAILDGTPFEGVDADGLQMTRLIVQKLRFERIIRGGTDLEAWFDRDPGAFTDAYKAYAAAVPPREYFPRQEAASFRNWCEKACRLPKTDV
jgi:hypothetical protein